MQSPDFFTQTMIKKRSRVGRRTSTDSLMSSPCVESVLTWLPLTASFQAELAVNIRGAISDIHHDVSKIREEIGGQVHQVSTSFIQSISKKEDTYSRLGSSQVSNPNCQGGQRLTFASSILGESPPPPPRACFGRDDLIERVVGLAENLTPMALIGPGGIGKTSIALAVLHHDRIKRRFGDNRRFIRCDEFQSSRIHLLNRLSKVIGAGVENPEGLAPLRPFLSRTEMILFLDNAESILDPQGENAREIYAVVEELSRFDNICLYLTSRISIIPPACGILDVPMLSIEAARNTFYHIYNNDRQSNPIDGILRQLDFHPLSITLLATVAHHSRWDMSRLTREWEGRRTGVLRTRHNDSLAATIELSLASPMFQELGPDAREVLGVIAFFPQGIDENNLDWLFPNLSDRANVFDNFSILSLTHRSNNFITMLAPLRDHLCPKDPASSPLLKTVKDRYFSRLSVDVGPGNPGFEDARWIIPEDVNVEHLLDVFTSVDANSVDVWDTCGYFMQHLYCHKVRLVTLGPKIEGLPDDHPSKPECLFQLSRLFNAIGDDVGQKQLLEYVLKLWRERGDDLHVAETLRFVSNVNAYLGLHKEGIEQAKEALEIYKRLDDITGQALTWEQLAVSLYKDKQLNAAEEAALRMIDLLADEDERPATCACYRTLAKICRSKGEMEKATSHFETALGIASRFNDQFQQFWIHCSLAELFFGENKFDEAHARVELAKSHATNDPYSLGRAMELEAEFWYKQGRFGEAKSEALSAISTYEKIGAAKDVEDCRRIIRDVEKATGKPATSH